ncbi:retinaldehyde-binding protein 1-like isoform X2 [Dermacentor albipictus]
MFLRARKYRVEEASQMVKNYFRARRDVPKFFHQLVPQNVPFRTICHDHKLLMISPEPGEYGRCMAVFKVGAWNPDICSLLDYTRAGLLLTNSWLLEDVPSICGVECVLDLEGLNILHLTQLTPAYLMKLATITQECCPVRIKAVYIVNHPKIFEVLFAAIKPFLRSKLLSRAKQNATITKTEAPLDLKEVARLELGETPETKADSLLRLRQLLAGEPSLKIPSSDNFLVMFLRARKYRVEEAFEMVKKYFRARRDVPEFFDELVPENVPFRTICHDHKLLMISPEPGMYGRSIGVFKIGAWNPDICSLLDYTRAWLLLTGSWLLEDVPSICGVESVMDMKGLNIRHLTQFTPAYLMKLANITQDCWPARIKAVYIINHPKIFEVLFAAIRPLLRSKLLNRVHFVGDEASGFWDHFPGDLVPTELGGRREHFDYDRQEKLVRSRTGFFESLCACGYKKNKA